MNKYLKQSLLFALFLNSTGHALHNPVQGFYGGILAEISHGPASSSLVFYNSNLDLVNNANVPITGLLTYDQVGGGAGGMLGYKFQHFRLEGELLYNRISTGPVRADHLCPVDNVNVFANNNCVTIDDQVNAGFKGSNPSTFGFVNAYYDFFTLDNDYNIVPYLGLGLGTARIKSLNNFVASTPYMDIYGNLVAPQFYFDASASTSAAQGIIGVSYYMDDFAWLSLDYRYITTRKFNFISSSNQSINLFNNSYTLNTLNITANFAFDIGGINC